MKILSYTNVVIKTNPRQRFIRRCDLQEYSDGDQLEYVGVIIYAIDECCIFTNALVTETEDPISVFFDEKEYKLQSFNGLSKYKHNYVINHLVIERTTKP